MTGAEGTWVEAAIFIVDDEAANVQLLKRVLEGAGYANVVTFTRSSDVIPCLEDTPPDLVMLDLIMPHPDGFEVLRSIGEHPDIRHRPPVLVLTADVTPGVRERSLSAGAMDFLSKPFDRLEVLLRVRNLLSRRRLELDLVHQNEVLERRVTERTGELRANLEHLRRTSRQRQALLERLVRAQEEERARIAVDIHDDTVQSLVALGIQLELLGRRVAQQDQRAELESVQALVSDALARLRALMFDLRPQALDDEGLAATIEQHLRRRLPDGPAFEVVSRLHREPPRVPRTVLFRIAQEAIANVRRHSRAEHVRVDISDKEEGVLLVVRDDGRGFDPRALGPAAVGHIGLTTMSERASVAGGWCRVESAPGAGTTVKAWVPRSARDPRPAALSPG